MLRRRFDPWTLVLVMLWATLSAAPAWAADPPGSLALDWPMGLEDGTQLLPGYDVYVLQNFANPNPDYSNKLHAAVDLARNSAATAGASVYAAADGQVVCAFNANYPGWVVVIEHTRSNGTKLYSQYGHLNSTLLVTNGQLVNRGTKLGTILSWPGNVANSHLHFEVRSFKNWPAGGCAGPGYADTGMTPLQQGWLDPIDMYFTQRPAHPGYMTTDINQSVRNVPNKNASTVIATLAAGSRYKTDQVVADQGGTDEWWQRVNYSGSSWGYAAGYWDNGWGGEIYSTELTRYPGPLGVAEVVVSGSDLYAFGRATNGQVKVNRRSSAGSWSGWTNLGGNATSEPAVAVNADGRVQVFVRGTDNTLSYRRQSAAGSAVWEAWTGLGGSLTSPPAVAVNSNGRLQVFIRSTDGALWTRAQTSAGGSWGAWASLGGILSYGPAVTSNSDGRLAVFVAGLNNNLYQIAQASAGGAFGAFLDLGGATTSPPSVVRNSDGKLEVFVRGAAPGHELRHIKQTTAGGAWGSWQTRGGNLTAQPRVVANADGRLEVFARGNGGALHNIWQTNAGGSWATWGTLGGFLTAAPVAANQGGKLQVLVLGTGGTLHHIGQTLSGWSTFLNLGGTYGPF